MKQTKILLLLFICSAIFPVSEAMAQRQKPGKIDGDEEWSYSRQVTQDKKFDWDKVIIGGNFGAFFGNTIFLDISPVVGYYVAKNFALGLGPSYQFYRAKYFDSATFQYVGKVNLSAVGGRAFARYDIWNGLFAYTEYETLYMKYTNKHSSGIILGEDKGTVPALFIGGGYSQSVGSRATMNIMILYDILENTHTLRPSPIVFRMGFGF